MSDLPEGLTPARLAQLKNLRPNKNKTDEEIIAAYEARKPKPKPLRVVPDAPKGPSYQKRFDQKMKILQKEYSIDMNNSNDEENLKALVRYQIQLEKVNEDIDNIQSQTDMSKDDYAKLKQIGDFQRTVLMSISDLQNSLGISRKVRKEKDNDDIPKWIDSVLLRAKEFYDGKTQTIECPKCVIELARTWINFPKEKNHISMELTCWKCKETVMYIG